MVEKLSWRYAELHLIIWEFSVFSLEKEGPEIFIGNVERRMNRVDWHLGKLGMKNVGVFKEGIEFSDG